MAGFHYGQSTFIPSSPALNSHNSEPMTIGSPSMIAGQPTGPQFLPSFLMGDLHAAASNFQASPAVAKSPPCSSPSQMSRFAQPHMSALKTMPTIDRSSRRHASPPTQSLWSTANHSRIGESGDVADGLTNSPRSSLVPQTLRPSYVASPFQMSGRQSILESNNGGLTSLSDDESSTWITVFGYPSSQASFVLQQFSHFGSIQKYLITNDGNWMHIKYLNKIQAKCALNKNGRVFPGNVMIGVRMCTDTEVMRSGVAVTPTSDQLGTTTPSRMGPSNENALPLRSATTAKLDSSVLAEGGGHRRLNASAVLTDNNNSMLGNKSFSVVAPPPQQSLHRGATGISRHSSMRPLAGSGPYYPPRVQVSRSNQGHSFMRGPSKTGLVSKALDYVFGWN